MDFAEPKGNETLIYFALNGSEFIGRINSMYTLPVSLANLMGEHIKDPELMMAGSVITIIPILIVFLALQKYYIKGIMMGSV